MCDDLIARYRRSLVLGALRHAIEHLDGPARDLLRRTPASKIESRIGDPRVIAWAAEVVWDGCSDAIQDSVAVVHGIANQQEPAESQAVRQRVERAAIQIGYSAPPSLRQLGEALRDNGNVFRWSSGRSTLRLPCPGRFEVRDEAGPQGDSLELLRQAAAHRIVAMLSVAQTRSVPADPVVGFVSPWSGRASSLASLLSQLAWSTIESLYHQGDAPQGKGGRCPKSDQEVSELARRQFAGLMLEEGLGAQAASDLLEAIQGVGVPIDVQSIAARSRVEVVRSGWPTRNELRLSPIEWAEVCLASVGDKVSRIAMRADDAANVYFEILAMAPAVLAAKAIQSKPDPCLDRFSNTIAAEWPIDDAPVDSEVFVYVASTAESARAAARLDRMNEAGELLDIPECCVEFFRANWEACSAENGDLFRRMLRLNATQGVVQLHWTCDASAMYRGGGYCWHFPCSPQCSETIARIEARARRIRELAPDLAHELDLAYRSTLRLEPRGSYSESRDGPGVMIDVSAIPRGSMPDHPPDGAGVSMSANLGIDGDSINHGQQ